MKIIDNSEKADSMCNEIKPIIEKYGYKNFHIWKSETLKGFNIEIFPDEDDKGVPLAIR